MCDRQSHDRSFVDDLSRFDVRMYDSLEFPKTGILATIGPASFNQVKVAADRPQTDLIEKMVGLGMNLIRINLAHVQDKGDRENIRLLLDRVQEIRRITKRPLGVSVDLAGPKFRIGSLDPVEIAEGSEFVFTLNPNYGVTQGTRGTPSRS